MKKILFLAFSMLAFTFWAQSQNASYNNSNDYYSDDDYKEALDYKEVISMLKADGYNISNEYYATLKEGETAYNFKTFYGYTNYIIVAISNDLNVSDLDLYVYNNGSLYAKDDKSDEIAVTHIYTYVSKYMKVVVKNAASDTPEDESTCRFVVAYK
jgi:hypothetical protein